MKYSLLLILLIVHSSVSEDCTEHASSNEAKLHRMLLCKYDRDNRPVKDHNKAVNVTVRMIVKMMEYSYEWDSIEHITIRSWMSMRWTDEFLTWNPDEFGGVDELVIHSSKIWLPDLSLYNNARGGATYFDYPCSITSKGIVACIPQLQHVALCKMVYKNWPYDKQNCTLTFGGWMHKGEHVNFFLASDPVSKADYTPNKHWELVSATAYKNQGVYKCCPNETYPTVKFTFEIKRYSALIVEQFLTPVIAMISLTITSLCLNISSLERILIMFFNVVCHFYYSYEMRHRIPGNGDVVPDAVKYFRNTSLLSCAILIHGVILKNILNYTTNAPVWMEKLMVVMSTRAGKIVFHEFDPNSTVSAEEVENLAEGDKDANKQDWKKIVFFFNRAFFVLVVVLYAIFILAYFA